MGSCLSKKSSAPSSSQASATAAVLNSSDNGTQVDKKQEKKMMTKKQLAEAEEEKKEEERVKKEIFVIKHRTSHDGVDRCSPDGVPCANNSPTSAKSEAGDMGINGVSEKCEAGGMGVNGGPACGNIAVRTSSCTKEEVDAILIQCGRLSRSSSGKASGSSGAAGSSRKYSGSKRSYDFDDDDGKKRGHGDAAEGNDCDNEDDDDDEKIHYRRRREHRGSRSSSHGRRRTPSREREQQQRSGSRDRGGGGSSSGGRRVSRSPGRRSENPPITSTNSAAAAAGCGAAEKSSAQANGGNSISTKPGKMVSVPASVTSLVMDKSNNNGGGGQETSGNAAIRRVLVRRNSGDVGVGSRTVASPRSQSPANSSCQQQPSLSRSSSRKAEQSPCRRNPLSEINTNSLAFSNKTANTKVQNNRTRDIDGEGWQAKELPSSLGPVKPNVEMNNSNVQGTNNKSSRRGALENNVATVSYGTKEQQHQITEETPEPNGMHTQTSCVEVTTIASGAEILKPQTLTRSRSIRRSRDLEFNPESLLNTTASYNTLLLEDIQNFHQKNTTAPSFSLPPCVTKACSILEAVADLNSCTSSNLSSAFSNDKRSPAAADSNNGNENNFSLGVNACGKKRLEAKDRFMESEVVRNDDLMEPSFHKYVTVRRGTLGGGDMEEQESSGSNSFAGGGQNLWGSSVWEPNSADSTDCWTSRSNAKEEEPSRPGFQRHNSSTSGCDTDEGRRRLSVKKRETGHQQNRVGCSRAGIGRGLHKGPTVATAAST